MTYCSYCEKELLKVFRCPCKTVTYCNRDCQKSDWKNHRAKHKSEIAKTTCSSTNRNSTKKQKKQKRKTKKPKVPKDARERIASMKWHYWSDTYTNNKGESLEYCLKNYGMGGWYSSTANKAVALVYLDESHDAGSSWLLGIWELSTGNQLPVRLQEEASGTYHAIGPPCMNTTFYNEEV